MELSVLIEHLEKMSFRLKEGGVYNYMYDTYLIEEALKALKDKEEF